MFTKYYKELKNNPFYKELEGEGIILFKGKTFKAVNTPLGYLTFEDSDKYIMIKDIQFDSPRGYYLLMEKLSIIFLHNPKDMMYQEHVYTYKTPRLFKVGTMPTGEHNLITDVAGVTVGHARVNNTGFTYISEANDDVFKKKCIGAMYCYNGFGKTMGSLQVKELGTIETPIVLTNTLDIPLAASCLIKDALKENPEIGTLTGTVNPIVGECNDGTLNSIRNRELTEADYEKARDSKSIFFDQGAVGAGSGMSCLGFKGGIGSASRTFAVDNRIYTLGVLVNSNFGGKSSLNILGKPYGEELDMKPYMDKGSIMVVVATDLPVSSRQLERIIKRAEIGIGRTGSYAGNGSGDVMIGFTTANRIDHYNKAFTNFTFISDNVIDSAFRACADATEEAVLNSLMYATDTVSENGVKKKESLFNKLEDFDEIMGEASYE